MNFYEKSFVEKINSIHLQSVRNSGLFYAKKLVWKSAEKPM